MLAGFTAVAALAPTRGGHRRTVDVAQGMVIVRPQLLAAIFRCRWRCIDWPINYWWLDCLHAPPRLGP